MLRLASEILVLLRLPERFRPGHFRPVSRYASQPFGSLKPWVPCRKGSCGPAFHLFGHLRTRSATLDTLSSFLRSLYPISSFPPRGLCLCCSLCGEGRVSAQISSPKIGELKLPPVPA
ncbi:hypothetical protein H8959_022423 [Pygathrix nigripes]